MQTSDRAVYAIWIELSAALMAVSAYGAWVKVGPAALNGTTGGTRGWIVLASGLLAGGVLWFRRATRSAGVYTSALGVAAVVAVVYDRTHLAEMIGSSQTVTSAAGAGWGLYVALAASISLTIGGAVWVAALASLPWAWVKPTEAVDSPAPRST